LEEKWMELEIIILSEIGQTQKDKHLHVFFYMQNLDFKKRKTRRKGM
jgi:hypothetical protein